MPTWKLALLIFLGFIPYILFFYFIYWWIKLVTRGRGIKQAIQDARVQIAAQQAQTNQAPDSREIILRNDSFISKLAVWIFTEVLVMVKCSQQLVAATPWCGTLLLLFMFAWDVFLRGSLQFQHLAQALLPNHGTFTFTERDVPHLYFKVTGVFYVIMFVIRTVFPNLPSPSYKTILKRLLCILACLYIAIFLLTPFLKQTNDVSYFTFYLVEVVLALFTVGATLYAMAVTYIINRIIDSLNGSQSRR